VSQAYVSSAVAPELPPGTWIGLRQQLEEALAAMDSGLRRAAAAAGIGRHGETASGVYAATGALLVGGRESHPLLLEAAAEALADLVRQRADAFSREDLYWTNDPLCGAASLEDLVVATPLLRGDALIGFVALTASHAGLGRSSLAPVEHLRQEGLILPWVCAARAGVVSPELRSLLVANSEAPADLLQDLAAHLHALRLGRETVEDLLRPLGTDIADRIHRRVLSSCGRALDHLWHGSERNAFCGTADPFSVRIEQTEQGVGVHLDHRLGRSLSPALARAAVRAALREVLSVEAPSLAIQGGLAEALDIVVGWEAPAARLLGGAARFAEAQRAAEAVFAAFAAPLAHLTHAPDGGCLLVDLRGARADGSRYSVRLALPGGLGAAVFGDGLTHATSPFLPRHLRSVEEVERAVPVRVVREELAPDSAGPGQYHGGSGARLELLLLEGRAEADVLLPAHAPGARGGMRGTPGKLTLLTPDAGTREEQGLARRTLPLRAGDRLILESPGGAGWGIPFQRSIMRLEEDLQRYLITPDHARNRYGLVLRPGSREKDDHLTYRVRHYLLSTLAVEDIIAGEELLD
jgi:N-methylhydantoinase B